MSSKAKNTTLLSFVVLLSMSLWFSASAIVPQLVTEWGISVAMQAWMTMSVQIGFVFGALTGAFLNVSDRYKATKVVALSSLVGAVANACIPLLSDGPASALVFRFITGAALAGVYPPAMKIMASWCQKDRGLCIGILVGAVTIGSGMPHLLSALSSESTFLPAWEFVLFGSSFLALAGGAMCYCFVESGPFLGKTAPFDWRQAASGLSVRPTRMVNYGYFGHMWELYAMWAWVPIMLMASYSAAEWGTTPARFAGFGVFLFGGLGSVLAGKLADKYGRTKITSVSLAASGACCILVGFFFSNPLLLTLVCLVWGFFVVADSAQFSAALTELADTRYTGTALQVQTSLGFLITLITLQATPYLIEAIGYEWVFLFLVPGPVFGLISMHRLRQMPESISLSQGKR